VLLTSTHEREEDEKAGDVPDHASQWDLQRPEDLEGRHEVRGPRDAHHVGHGKQDIGHDLRVVRSPVKPRFTTANHHW